MIAVVHRMHTRCNIAVTLAVAERAEIAARVDLGSPLFRKEMIAGVPMDRLLPLIPLGRIGRPEEVAGVVDFLLGEAGTYVTGQVIGINGGLYM